MGKCVLVTLLVLVGVMIAGMGYVMALEETTPAVEAAQEAPQFDKIITLPEGSQGEVPVTGIKRILIGAPNVLSAENSDSKLRLTAKQQGTTVVAVWTDDGRSSYQVRVVPHEPEVGEAVRLAQAAPPTAQVPMLPAEDISLEPGASRLLKGQNITRTSVSNPDIVDIVPVSSTEVLANAKKEGQATVRVWDRRGQSTYNFTVEKKGPTPEEIAAEITKQIGIPTISARVTGDTVILSGTAPSVDIASKAARIAEASGRKVVSLVMVETVSAEMVVASLKAAMPDEPLTYQVLPDKTVMIKGTVATEQDARRIEQVVQTWVGTPEQATSDKQTVTTRVNFVGQQEETPPETVDKSRVMALAPQPGEVVVSEEFNFTRRVFGGRIANGPRLVAMIEINPALAQQVLVSAQVLEIDRSKLKTLGIQWAEILGTNPIDPLIIFEDRPTPVGLDDGGPVRRTNLSASVKALINEDAAKVLSEPKILITDGHSANILVGGEIPIPVAQNATVGSTSITVQFKPFGIQLTVRPKITPDGRILLTVGPEVSSLDFTNAVRLADFLIPALRTRRVTTTVHMANGESLAIGGLLSSEDVKTVDRVPLLSKIPVIGELFKSRRFTKDETELIILVTPQIVEKGAIVPIAAPRE